MHVCILVTIELLQYASAAYINFDSAAVLKAAIVCVSNLFLTSMDKLLKN